MKTTKNIVSKICSDAKKTYLVVIFYKLASNSDIKIFETSFYSKNNFKKTNMIGVLNQFSSSDDNIVIGKTYNYLSRNLQKESQAQNTLVYYLKLMENQYLPN